jgi:dTDP-L-rhamnose 4-epimerase
VQRLIVASSMSIYGEGLYRSADGCICATARRSLEQLKAGNWDVRDRDGRPLDPVPTPESKLPEIASVYALGKYDQELMCLMIGQAYNIPAVALRFFNVYGTRQSLSNPYTGVLAIFISRLLNDNPPLVYEDGKQKRDFVSVHDIARACLLALESPQAPGNVFNIGSGQSITISQVAQSIANVLGKSHIKPQVTGKYRVGDIRNCFADISLARQVLKYEPQVSFEHGLQELASWVSGQSASDYAEAAATELNRRRLMV